MPWVDAAAEDAAKRAREPVRLLWPARSGSQPARVLSTITAESGDVRLTRPFGIAVDAAERVFVAEPNQRAVFVFDRKAGSAARWTGTGQHVLSGPVAVAVDGEGRLYAADAFQPQVVVFDPSGNAIGSFGKGVLQRPGGIAIDARHGRIWVGDVRQNQVIAFDLRSFDPGERIGGFSSPGSLAVNSKGHLHVSDMWNCRIQVFSAAGKLLRRFGIQCAHTSEYGRPNAIAIDRDDRVYVADADDNSLQIFGPDGKPQYFVANLGVPPKHRVLRTGLAVDQSYRVYTTEQAPGAGRVQVYDQSGVRQ